MGMTVQTVTVTKHHVIGTQDAPYVQAVVGPEGARIKIKELDERNNLHVRSSQEAREWEELFLLLRLKLEEAEKSPITIARNQEVRRQIEAVLHGGGSVADTERRS